VLLSFCYKVIKVTGRKTFVGKKDNLEIIERPSPNFSERPEKNNVDMVILHYTGMKTVDDALRRLCDPKSEVSAHYLIDETGVLYSLVEEYKTAWHAGQSYWQGATNINARSIGIELSNPGHDFGYRAFPEEQMAALEKLLALIIAKHSVCTRRIVGHSDVAPTRKTDPGELFDWQRLAFSGLSIWPKQNRDPVASKKIPWLLKEIGYDPNIPMDAAITAFQRRFLPHRLTGYADEETRATIAAVHSMCS